MKAEKAKTWNAEESEEFKQFEDELRLNFNCALNFLDKVAMLLRSYPDYFANTDKQYVGIVRAALRNIQGEYGFKR